MIETQSFAHMQVEQLAQVIDDKTHVVVDIRDETSFNNGRISDALHLTNENLADFFTRCGSRCPSGCLLLSWAFKSTSCAIFS